MTDEREEMLRKSRINDLIINSGVPTRYYRLSFSDYKTSNKDQSEVLEDCKRFCDGSFDTGIIMVGRNGTGKTMLSTLIIREMIKSSDNSYTKSQYVYTEAIKIIRQIKDSWRKKTSEQEVINLFVKPEVLAIDEIGMQYQSDTERQFLTEIINDRYNHKRRTILSGNISVKEMHEILGDRIIDRFRQGGKVLVFNWDSHRKGK